MIKYPKNGKFTIAIGEEVIQIPFKDFEYTENVSILPPYFAYLVSLKDRLFNLMKACELEKDKYYSARFMDLKQDEFEERPRSDRWVNAEILEDEEYLELLELCNQTVRNYRLVSDLIKAFQNKIDIARTIISSERVNKQNY